MDSAELPGINKQLVRIPFGVVIVDGSLSLETLAHTTIEANQSPARIYKRPRVRRTLPPTAGSQVKLSSSEQ
jgi:acyl dehydratase